MPESLHLPPVASAVVTITGVVLAIVRLLTASKAFWWKFPEWLQKGLPALLVALGSVPMAIEHATSWLQIVEAGLFALGTWFTASRGDKRPVDATPPNSMRRPPVLPVLYLFGLAVFVSVQPWLVGCGSKVNWPAVVHCAGVLEQPALDAVTKVLHGTGDVETELADVARSHGAEVVECAVQQVISDLTSRSSASVTEARAVHRGRAFLAAVQR